MRLTLALLRKKMPPGNIWGGKHRMHLIPEQKHVERVTKQFAIEQQNMLLLRHPFLTMEQSFGYARDLKKHEKWLAETIEKNIKPYKPNVTTDERLAVLNNSNSWD